MTMPILMTMVGTAPLDAGRLSEAGAGAEAG